MGGKDQRVLLSFMSTHWYLRLHSQLPVQWLARTKGLRNLCWIEIGLHDIETMEQMKNSVKQHSLFTQEEKNHIALWNFWNDFESCVFHQVIISLLAHGIRESVTTAGIGWHHHHFFLSLCYYTMALQQAWVRHTYTILSFLKKKCLLIIYQLLASPIGRFNLGYLSRWHVSNIDRSFIRKEIKRRGKNHFPGSLFNCKRDKLLTWWQGSESLY